MDRFIWAFIHFDFSTFFQKCWKKIEQILANVNHAQIAYLGGQMAGLVLEAIISIVFTGGSLTAANILAEMTSVATAVGKGAKKAAQFSAQKVEDLISYLDTATKKLQKGPDELAKVVDDFSEEVLVKKNLDALATWDDLPVRKKGMLGGKTLRRKEVKLWKDKIAKISNNTAELIILPKGNKILGGKQAGFSPFSRKIYLQKGLTEYEILHEYKHLEEFMKIGEKEYKKGHKLLGGSPEEQLIRTYKREMYVYKEILKQKHKFNAKQLEHAYKKIFFPLLIKQKKTE
ncbi:MAG: hypothetical protein N4A45_03125 [Flavobacteriales bacterium]|nr:hypothetical protein [Flavobacteriales bacterium]